MQSAGIGKNGFNKKATKQLTSSLLLEKMNKIQNLEDPKLKHWFVDKEALRRYMA